MYVCMCMYIYIYILYTYKKEYIHIYFIYLFMYTRPERSPPKQIAQGLRSCRSTARKVLLNKYIQINVQRTYTCV